MAGASAVLATRGIHLGRKPVAQRPGKISLGSRTTISNSAASGDSIPKPNLHFGLLPARKHLSGAPICPPDPAGAQATAACHPASVMGGLRGETYWDTQTCAAASAHHGRLSCPARQVFCSIWRVARCYTPLSVTSITLPTNLLSNTLLPKHSFDMQAPTTSNCSNHPTVEHKLRHICTTTCTPL